MIAPGNDAGTEETRQVFKITGVCPYCGREFKKPVEMAINRTKITSHVVKVHENCRQFVAFIDPNGKVRGTQTIDSVDIELQGSLGTSQEDEEGPSLEAYMSLFENDESLFYHVRKLGPGSNYIATKQVKFHNLLRSEFFNNWIERILEAEIEFGTFCFDDIVVATIQFYDTIFTAGYDMEKFQDEEVIGTGVNAVFDYLKSRAMLLCEKMLS